MDEFRFSEDYLEDKYILLEMPSEEFLQGVLSGQIKLEFVANDKQPISLCSENKSFDLLEFDTSNSLLLHDGPLILSNLSSTFEMRDKNPPFLSFRQMLHANPITEAEIKSSTIQDPISYEELKDTTLCSRIEFEDMVIRLAACNINGFIKTPSEELNEMVTDQIIRYSQTLEDWKRVNVNEMLNSFNFPLMNYPFMKIIVKAVLKSLCIEIQDDIAVLDENKILIFIARMILKNSKNGFITIDDFKNEMKGQMPQNARLNLEIFKGLYAKVKNGFHYINEEALPLDPEQRFAFLFQVKKEWEQSDIEPFFAEYISDKILFPDYASRYARFANGLWMQH